MSRKVIKQLIKVGFELVKLRKGEKTPAASQDSTQWSKDVDTLMGWYEDGFNLGIRCKNFDYPDNPVKQLLILDIDDYVDGATECFAALQKKYNLPDTFTQVTQTGASHKIYSCSKSDQIPQFASPEEKASLVLGGIPLVGFDIRTAKGVHGGYVVAASSELNKLKAEKQHECYKILEYNEVAELPDEFVNDLMEMRGCNKPLIEYVNKHELYKFTKQDIEELIYHIPANGSRDDWKSIMSDVMGLLTKEVAYTLLKDWSRTSPASYKSDSSFDEQFKGLNPFSNAGGRFVNALKEAGFDYTSWLKARPKTKGRPKNPKSAEVIAYEEAIQNEEIKRPSFISHTEDGYFAKIEKGIWYHGWNSLTDKPQDVWVCSPLRVEALACNEEGKDTGVVLSYENAKGETARWVMPKRMVNAGGGEDMRNILIDYGVRIGSKNHLNDYIMRTVTEDVLTSTTKTGWTEDKKSFVTPDFTIGSDVLFQSQTDSEVKPSVKGTLEDWKDTVGKYCIDNDVLTAALCVPLSGVLLRRVDGESGALHLVGGSSKGKTTALNVGISIVGGTALKGSWRATGNGLEGVAERSNDTMLALDELSEANPQEVQNIVYAISNGQGKIRASKNGDSKSVKKWKTAILSTGEKSIASKMMEANKKPDAGCLVRFLSVPATENKYGCFNTIHGFESASVFSRHLKNASAKNYGTPLVAFIESLLKEEDLHEEFESFKRSSTFRHEVELLNRGGERFALLAWAGVKAVHAGILPHTKEQIIKSIENMYQLWLEDNIINGAASPEDAAILNEIRDFIFQNMDTAFTSIDKQKRPDGEESFFDPTTRTARGGYYTDEGYESRAYLITSEVLVQRICKGRDLQSIAKALDRSGVLVAKDKGKLTKKKQIKNESFNFYYICFSETEKEVVPPTPNDKRTDLFNDKEDENEVDVRIQESKIDISTRPNTKTAKDTESYTDIERDGGANSRTQRTVTPILESINIDACNDTKRDNTASKKTGKKGPDFDDCEPSPHDSAQVKLRKAIIMAEEDKDDVLIEILDNPPVTIKEIDAKRKESRKERDYDPSHIGGLDDTYEGRINKQPDDLDTTYSIHDVSPDNCYSKSILGNDNFDPEDIDSHVVTATSDTKQIVKEQDKKENSTNKLKSTEVEDKIEEVKVVLWEERRPLAKNEVASLDDIQCAKIHVRRSGLKFADYTYKQLDAAVASMRSGDHDWFQYADINHFKLPKTMEAYLKWREIHDTVNAEDESGY